MRNFIIYEFNPDNEWVTIEVLDIFNNTHLMDVKRVDLVAYEVS